MELLGIFVTIIPKEEALIIIDRFTNNTVISTLLMLDKMLRSSRHIATMRPKLSPSVLHRRCGVLKDV